MLAKNEVPLMHLLYKMVLRRFSSDAKADSVPWDLKHTCEQNVHYYLNERVSD